MHLYIFASRIYRRNDYKEGLRTVWEAGAQMAIMNYKGQCGLTGLGSGQGEACGELLVWLSRIRMCRGEAFICCLQR